MQHEQDSGRSSRFADVLLSLWTAAILALYLALVIAPKVMDRI